MWIREIKEELNSLMGVEEPRGKRIRNIGIGLILIPEPLNVTTIIGLGMVWLGEYMKRREERRMGIRMFKRYLSDYILDLKRDIEDTVIW